MIIQDRKICEIELTPNELKTLSKASDIFYQIVDTATAKGIIGFKVAQEWEDYSSDDFSNCARLLEDICHPCGRLSGYFQEWRSSAGET